MGAAKTSNSKDTYMATAVAFMVIGALYLIDKLIHFSSIGLPWVMNKDNMLLYASICFLIFKRDKSIGFVLLGLWLRNSSSFIRAWTSAWAWQYRIPG